jgi:hypothetical protein
MTSQVEVKVELPTFTIAPLERGSELYWKKLVVGWKQYRIQYADRLHEPSAEIDFSDLIHFLLD